MSICLDGAKWSSCNVESPFYEPTNLSFFKQIITYFVALVLLDFFLVFVYIYYMT